MNNGKAIVLHGSEREVFDPMRLHSSIVSACLSVRAPEGEAQSTAERVCQSVVGWLGTKNEVTSTDIRLAASKRLATYHPEAAYMYQNKNMMV